MQILIQSICSVVWDSEMFLSEAYLIYNDSFRCTTQQFDIFIDNMLYSYYKICCCLVAKLCPTLLQPWTVTHQAPLSMGFPRQEYWSGLPFLSPEDLPDPGIEPTSSALAGRFFTTEPPRQPWGGMCTSNSLNSADLGISRIHTFFPCWPHHSTCGILVPQPRI